MRKGLPGLFALSLMTTAVQAQPPAKAVPEPAWNTDTQAQAAKPGTVTSHNPENAAIAKIDAAGKNPNPGPRGPAPLSEPGGPGTAENNSGGR